MSSLTPHPGQRTRDAITYGDPMKDETLEVAATWNGTVEIVDGATGTSIALSPEKAKQLGRAIAKAARWASEQHGERR
jgi:hypothetical protein